MQTTDPRTEEMFNAFHHIASHSFKGVFTYVFRELSKFLHANDDPLPVTYTVKAALDKRSWSEFSRQAMQVPEGLTGNLFEFSTLLGDDGVYLTTSLKDILHELDDDLSLLLTDNPINLSGRKQEVDKHLTRQVLFYEKYRTFIKDNGLSHQPIQKVFHSPLQVVKWYNTTKLVLPQVTVASVKEWDALLKTLSTKLDAYVNKLQREATNTQLVQEQVFSQTVNAIASKVDVVVTISMALMMNRRTAVVFAKQLLEK